MKNLVRFIGAASAAAIVSAQPLLGQTWQTVLNYQLSLGKPADGNGIVTDVLGNVFSGGIADDAAGVSHGLVLKTDVTQANWFVSDDTDPSPTQFDSPIWALGADSFGNVYSVGQLTPNNTGTSMPVPYWYVRKSSDQGINWSTVDLYQYASSQWIDATGFAADDLGNVYVVGWGRSAPLRKNGTANLHWLVRKSADSGRTWALVDDLEGPSGGFGANGAAFVPGVGIFVVGPRFPSSSTTWLVRRSVNAGASWSTVDSQSAGGAFAVGSDSQGNIFVIGTQIITTTTPAKPKPIVSSYSAWTTRKSSDGGNTWSTADTFTYAQNQNAHANGIGRNAAGNVVVAGNASDSQGTVHWIVRTPDSFGTWQTVDDFQLVPGKSAIAEGVTTDAAANLLVTGNAQDATGSHWIVRRASANP